MLRVSIEQQVLVRKVTLVRTESGLIEALGQLQELEVQTRRGQNMLMVAQFIAMAALAREESRGAHYRVDYPEPAAAWAHGSIRTLEALASGIPTSIQRGWQPE